MKFLAILLLLPMVILGQNYTSKFENGVRVEIFTHALKTYVGQPFLDTVVHSNCEVIDSNSANVFKITWIASGDDTTTGVAAGNVIDWGIGTKEITVSIPNTDSVPAGDTTSYILGVDTSGNITVSVSAYDEAGNVSPKTSKTVNAPTSYLQIQYNIDTTYFIIRTYPELMPLPQGLQVYNGIAITNEIANYRNILTLYVSNMRKKDLSMDNSVDLTDLAMLIWYLTSGGR